VGASLAILGDNTGNNAGGCGARRPRAFWRYLQLPVSWSGCRVTRLVVDPQVL